MTSHANIFPATSATRPLPRAWMVAWRRHAFILPAMLVAWSVCFWFATTGDGHLFYREYFCGFYDAQAHSILHAHLDVAPKAIGFEAFDRDGKAYGYFGVTPALLRIPLVLAFPGMDGRWSRMMMLIACGMNLVCAYRLIRHLKPSHEIETDAGRIIAILFVLCAGIGSTTVFLVSRSYVYHEAIMWGSTFALLFADRLLAYLATPNLNLLVAAGACAFLSFHSRATAGAGTLLAMCIITLVLIHRTIWRRSSAAPVGSASSLGINWRAVVLDRLFRVRRGGRGRPPSRKIPSSSRAILAPTTNTIRDADPTKFHTDDPSYPHSAPNVCSNVFGLNPTGHPGLHALVGAIFVTITIAAYFGINYAKFHTFEGVPVQFYRMYTTNPARMKITGGRQFHLENIPTGIASYFSGNGLSLRPEFPWVYMVERARVLGKPALDVVEPYSGIPVSMPALFLLAVAGIQPVIRGRTPETRRLRLPAIALLLGGCVVLATVGITERYLHDFYPWLIVLAAAGACRLMTPGRDIAKIAAMATLTGISIALNCAFALYFQREYVWGEPDAKRVELVYARQIINRVLHRPPPPPVTEQP